MNLSLSHYRHYIYALLLLLPTYAGVSVVYYLLFVFSVLTLERKEIASAVIEFRKEPLGKKQIVLWFTLLIVLTSLLNKIFNGQPILCTKDYYAPFYLFPLLVLCAYFAFSLRFFKALIVITAFEVIFAVLEYFIGSRSILLDLGDSNIIYDYDLLYNSRVYGLSVNSSVLSLKLFIAVLLIDFVKFKPWQSWTIRIILTIGLLISFSRIVVVLVLLYLLGRFLIGLIQKRRSAVRAISIQYSGAILILFLIFNSTITNQLLRGDHDAESVFEETEHEEHPRNYQRSCAEIHALKLAKGELNPLKQGWGDKLMLSAEKVQSSGRKLIWLNYLNYIEDNLLFGNGSDKLMFRKWDPKKGNMKLIHAHNSYLELVASNGILISTIILLFYLLVFKSRNFLPIGIIMLYSVGNYGIFWGFSYLDVIFLMLLIFHLKPVYDDKGKG